MQSLKQNNCPWKILYPAKLFFNLKREIKTFHDKDKLKQFMSTKLHWKEYSKE
jgi:hypothetical protein